MHRKINKVLLVTLILALSAHAWAREEPLHPVKGNPPAADFSLTDIDERRHTLSGYRGKVVIVNFWATWCPPCRFELPSMDRAWQRLKDKDVVMLGINVGEDAETIFTFTSDYPVTFPLLMDRDSSVLQKYPVIGLPTTFIISPEGKLVYKAIGTREWDADEVIQKVLELRHN